METLRFYLDETTIDGYSFRDIMKLPDSKLEQQTKIIKHLFPDQIDTESLSLFKKDKKLRKNVVQSTLRMMELYGYTLDKETNIMQIKEIRRVENGLLVGLYSTQNFPRLTLIMNFLDKINMKKLSALVFLMICHALKKDAEFKRKVKLSGVFPTWLSTQPYMKKYKNMFDIDNMKFATEEDTPTDDDYLDEDDSAEEVEFEETKFQTYCANFQGLDYTGNSCYQDSVLLALFAIPNKIITDGILDKDIKPSALSKKKWISCGDTDAQDLENRKLVQHELRKITNSMRNLTGPKTCSDLRKVLRNCPGAQSFHDRGMQDAGEFILYLFNIFELNTITKNRITYVTNNLKNNENLVQTFQETQVSTPIFNIPSQTLVRKCFKEYPPSLKHFLKNIDDSVLSKDNLYIHPDTGDSYQRRIEVINVISASYIIFYVQRLHLQDNNRITFQVAPVKIPESIVIGHKTLRLHAIVVYSPEHYTTYIKCNKWWFYYDDISTGSKHKIKYVGTYDKMLRSNPKPSENGTLFFYS